MQQIRLIRIAAFVVMIVASVSQAQHAGDLWIGRSAAGQLKIDTIGTFSGFNPASAITILQPDELGGFSLSSPGFDRLTTNQPDEDTYTLAAGAQIQLQIVSNDQPPTLAGLAISPALFIYDPVTFWFYPYEYGGTLYREIYLGGYQVHKHVTWFIDPLDPLFDSTQCTWELTAQLIDNGTTHYAPSEPFTLRFALHPLIPGDSDCDQDVDEADLAFFLSCGSGPAVPAAEPCRNADLDSDQDVDAIDFAILQRCRTPSGVTGDPDCAHLSN